MRIIKGKDFTFKDTCVTIGKFDGVHLGHRKILSEMNKVGKEQGLKKVVLTFDFSFFSSNESERLNSYDEKLRLLEEVGTEVMIDYPFDDETRMQPAEDFIISVLVKRLGVKAVIIGDNFRFGYKAKGDTNLLKEYGDKFGFEVIVVPCVKYEGSVISSTRIRDELSLGHDRDAYNMLFDNKGM